MVLRYRDMLQDELIEVLLSPLLPKEVSENFTLVGITDEPMEGCPVLHLHFEEHNDPPADYPDAVPNGFYEGTVVGDFPIRDRAVMLHVKRRRWKDAQGKSLPAKVYTLTADSTRLSCEFADFLKRGL